MKRYLEVKLDPADFPFHTYEHTPNAVVDILHWHDYLQIGLGLEGKGKFIFKIDSGEEAAKHVAQVL